MKKFGKLFLSVGAMKAGTSWLYEVLSHHPDLCFSYEKEIHYFCHRYTSQAALNNRHRQKRATALLRRFVRPNGTLEQTQDVLSWMQGYISDPIDDQWFQNLFRPSPGQYCCDFSNLNAHLPPAAWQKIHHDCEDLRVLYMLRHPLKRLWSHVKFHLEMHNELGKLNTWGPDDYQAFAKQPALWRNAQYGTILQNLNAGLPETALKVLFYEDMHKGQRKMLAEIETFLGIAAYDYPDEVLNSTVNKSSSRKMPDFFPELFANDVKRFTSEVEALGYTLPNSWR